MHNLFICWPKDNFHFGQSPSFLIVLASLLHNRSRYSNFLRAIGLASLMLLNHEAVKLFLQKLHRYLSNRHGPTQLNGPESK
jgi:hypothetical protein